MDRSTLRWSASKVSPNMPRYDHLRTATFRLDLAQGDSWGEAFHVLSFPEIWKEPLLGLSRRRGGDDDRNNIWVDSLNRAFILLAPDLVTVSRGVTDRGQSRPWLYSREPIPPEALLPIVRAWVSATYAHAAQSDILRVVDGMQPEHLTWHPHTVQMGNWATLPNGTADPSNEAYTLLSQVLAARLSRDGIAYDHARGTARFRRAPAASGDGAELMSWPPIWLPDRHGEEWPCSLLLQFQLETRAFEAAPVVHCSVGLRRWVKDRFEPRRDRETTVYLAGRLPWIAGFHHSSSFQMAPIRWQSIPRNEQADGHRGTVAWGSDLPSILERLTYQEPLPQPADFCVDPMALLGDGDVVAAIVYSTALDIDHGIGAGLMPKDRRPLLEWVDSVLDAPVRLAPPLEKASSGLTHRRVKRLGRALAHVAGYDVAGETEDTTENTQRRLALAEQMKGALSVDVLWLTEGGRDRCIARMCLDLGLSDLPPRQLDGGSMQWERDGLALTVTSTWLGALGEPLAVNGTDRWNRDKLHRAMRQRADEVHAALPATSGPAAALVELWGEAHYRGNPAADPKFALRRALSSGGRISQFVTPREEGSRERESEALFRTEKAWNDLLRQLGVQLTAPCFDARGETIPDPLQYVGLWLIKQRRGTSPTRMPQRLPVAVRLASNTTEVLALAPGFERWLPYREALLRLAQLDLSVLDPRQGNQITGFIRQVLEDVEAWGDALVMAHAQNLRNEWPYLQNRMILQDAVQFLREERPAPIFGHLGLRLVRVRTSDGGETPQCFGEEDEDLGFPKGLWYMGGEGRVFGSTANKPVTAKHLSATLSKFDSWQTRTQKNYDARPDAHAFNPRLVELTVAAIQQGDAPWIWAALAHELRFVAPHHDDAITLPLPLHLAKLMEEYVLPLSELELLAGK
jgi:hypothetical protein